MMRRFLRKKPDILYLHLHDDCGAVLNLSQQLVNRLACLAHAVGDAQAAQRGAGQIEIGQNFAQLLLYAIHHAQVAHAALRIGMRPAEDARDGWFGADAEYRF